MTDEPDQVAADLRPLARADATRTVDYLRREEFSAFYRNHAAMLVGFLVTQGARAADATDIAQDTMIKLWKSWSTIESPMAWARVVAGRELVRRLGAVEEDNIDESEHSALLGAASDIDDWVRRDEYQRVLANLPPRQRQVLIWTTEGYSPAEIAVQLKLNAATVRSNLRKARRAVALHLQKGAQQ
ncbi:sigma-70 family RNA polymerase sigma factor [Nocardia sp. NPDC050697]|uniref:RNA polymerase sigma factor n=1 Tax=Nocardia sp. NPDC050697 TaxID=3155158 RepID=UPI0033EDF66A